MTFKAKLGREELMIYKYCANKYSDILKRKLALEYDNVSSSFPQYIEDNLFILVQIIFLGGIYNLICTINDYCLSFDNLMFIGFFNNFF